MIPAVIFLVGAAISFATGTSWGSYAILMPIAIPLGNDLGISQALVIGSVLSGGLFGDHCSPISDTTILASIGSASDLMDHVRTQLPYALLAALAAAVAYYVAARTGSAWGCWSAYTLNSATVRGCLGLQWSLFRAYPSLQMWYADSVLNTSSSWTSNLSVTLHQ